MGRQFIRHRAGRLAERSDGGRVGTVLGALTEAVARGGGEGRELECIHIHKDLGGGSVHLRVVDFVTTVSTSLIHSLRPRFTGAAHPPFATSGQRPNSLTPSTRRPLCVCVCVCVFALMSCLPSLGHHHTIHRPLVVGCLKEGDQQRHRIHPCRLRCIFRCSALDRCLRCPPNRYL